MPDLKLKMILQGLQKKIYLKSNIFTEIKVKDLFKVKNNEFLVRFVIV